MGAAGASFYIGSAYDPSFAFLPAIGNGRDMDAFLTAMMPFVTRTFAALCKGQQEPEENTDELNAALGRLPDKPDENLR